MRSTFTPCLPTLILLITFLQCKAPESSTHSYDSTLNLVPIPVSVETGKGSFTIDESTTLIITTPSKALIRIAEMFQDKIKTASGLELTLEEGKPGKNAIVLRIDQELEHQEGYTFHSSSDGIEITGQSPIGIFYAFQTFRQLLPDDFESEGGMVGNGLTVPAVTINDYPRFKYRGMHLDVCRHFFPVEVVKKYIDQLAYHKMNRFHWHLTEDQGWRIEIKRYPKLAEIAAWRDETLVGHYNDRPQKFDGKRYGGYYTQEEIKEVVQYAADRFITIIPEIEMPGHSTAALAAYPELACTDGPFKVATKWGIFEDVYCPTETTFEFLEGVLEEVIELFPGEYIHIGGDECPKSRWKESQFCQDLMKKEGLEDEMELQSYFIKRIEKFINSKGKNIIGWDEILEGGLAPNATVMSWRGTEGGIAAAKQGHDVVMTPTSHCYFDYYQDDHPDEPLAIGGFLPLEKVYNYEPIPDELTAEEAKHILGTQGNVWTEYIPNPDHLFYMAFPRASALAEVNWSPKVSRNYENFLVRIDNHINRMELMGVKPANHLYNVKGKIHAGDGKGVRVELFKGSKAGEIQYHLQGSKPGSISKKYSEPIEITESSSLSARMVIDRDALGRMYKQQFDWHKGVGKKITFVESPAERYSVGGKGAVVNGVRGSTEKYGDSEWLGWEGMDVEALIELGGEEVSKVTLHFFNGEGQWIYLPKQVTVSYSEDGEQFFKIGESDSINGDTKVVTVPIETEITKVRTLKIEVKRFGKIPDGAQGAGHEAWTFLDEIIIE